MDIFILLSLVLWLFHLASPAYVRERGRISMDLDQDDSVEPTWSKIMDANLVIMSDTPADQVDRARFWALMKISNQMWNWVAAQTSAPGEFGSVLVACIHYHTGDEVKTPRVWCSTVPRGAQKRAMLKNAETRAQSMWYQLQHGPPDHGKVTTTKEFHAEDGAYYVYESSDTDWFFAGTPYWKPGDRGESPILAVYGYGHWDKDKEVQLLGHPVPACQIGRKPSCSYVAEHLGVYTRFDVDNGPMAEQLEPLGIEKDGNQRVMMPLATPKETQETNTNANKGSSPPDLSLVAAGLNVIAKAFAIPLFEFEAQANHPTPLDEGYTSFMKQTFLMQEPYL